MDATVKDDFNRSFPGNAAFDQAEQDVQCWGNNSVFVHVIDSCPAFQVSLTLPFAKPVLCCLSCPLFVAFQSVPRCLSVFYAALLPVGLLCCLSVCPVLPVMVTGCVLAELALLVAWLTWLGLQDHPVSTSGLLPCCF